MTSRTTTFAMNGHREAVLASDLNFLEEIVDIFQNLCINSPRRTWKPVQSGLILTTTTALRMQDIFLHEKGFNYLFLSRFTQDALENLFSTVRAKNPVPRAKDFKMALRLITMSQFFRPSRSGSYNVDDSAYLAQFASTLPAQEETIEEEVSDREYYSAIDDNEQQSLYHVAGYIVRRAIQRYKLCDHCKLSLKTTNSCESSRLCELKDYSRGDNGHLLVKPANSVFSLVLAAEGEFRKYENLIVQSKKTLEDVHRATAELTKQIPFPPCHELAKKLLDTFFLFRIRIALRQKNEEFQKEAEKTSKCGSRSMGMRAAVLQLY